MQTAQPWDKWWASQWGTRNQERTQEELLLSSLHCKAFSSFIVVVVKSPSHVQLSVTPWTVVRLLCPPLPEFSQIQVHRISDAIQPSHPLSHPSPPAFNLSQHQSFSSEFFTSGSQSIGVSVSASVPPVNIQDWFPLWWTVWLSLLSKGLSRIFSNIAVQKHSTIKLSQKEKIIIKNNSFQESPSKIIE